MNFANRRGMAIAISLKATMLGTTMPGAAWKLYNNNTVSLQKYSCDIAKVPWAYYDVYLSSHGSMVERRRFHCESNPP
jgi:hypothetical protein